MAKTSAGLAAFAAFIAPATAQQAALESAQEAAVTICRNGADERRLEVVRPGVVGRACDLRVVRDGGSYVSTPYHANNQASYCATKADELARDLAAAGFSCVASTGDGSPPEIVSARSQTAQTAGARSETGVATAPQAALPPAPGVRSAAERDPGPDPIPTPVPPLPDGNQAESEIEFADMSAPPIAAAPIPQPASPAALTEERRIAAPSEPTTITQPSAESPPAIGGPIQLTAAAQTAQVSTSAGSAAGRLVGASPARVELPTEPSVQSVSAPDGVPAPQSAGPVLRTAANDDRANAKARPAPDLIKNVLAAQAAAWNEGDLDAFMEGYWNSPKLRMVSGRSVTTGWKKIAKRYAERYGSGRDLGVLSFEKLSVDMVEDDVAIVVGRFMLDQQGDESSGSFSLVMRRFDGLWRIVHDHTTADVASP